MPLNVGGVVSITIILYSSPIIVPSMRHSRLEDVRIKLSCYGLENRFGSLATGIFLLIQFIFLVSATLCVML